MYVFIYLSSSLSLSLSLTTTTPPSSLAINAGLLRIVAISLLLASRDQAVNPTVNLTPTSTTIQAQT